MTDLLRFLDVDPDVRLDLGRWHNVTRGSRAPVRSGAIRRVKAVIRAVVPDGILEYARNVSAPPRRSDVLPSERARVIEMYEADVRELASLIQRDLSAWLDPCRVPVRDSISSR